MLNDDHRRLRILYQSTYCDFTLVARAVFRLIVNEIEARLARPSVFIQTQTRQRHFPESVSKWNQTQNIYTHFDTSIMAIPCIDFAGAFHSPIIQAFQFIDEDGFFIIRPGTIGFVVGHHQLRSHRIYDENSDGLHSLIFCTVFGAVHNKIGTHSLGPGLFSQLHLFQSESIELAIFLIDNKHQNLGDHFHLPVAYVISTY